MTHAPEMPSPMRALLDPDDLHEDAVGVSLHFHARRRNRMYSEESKFVIQQERIKAIKRAVSIWRRVHPCRVSEGKVRKVQNFKEEEGRVKERDDLTKKIIIKRLQKESSQLSTRNDNLMSSITSESQRARTLEETIFKLE